MVGIRINGKANGRQFQNMGQALAFASNNGECVNAETLEFAYKQYEGGGNGGNNKGGGGGTEKAGASGKSPSGAGGGGGPATGAGAGGGSNAGNSQA